MQGNFEPLESFLSFVPVEIKERIIQKGEELFFRHGVKSVTMDDIAKSLGVSKKTIYQNFKDKKMFVNAVTQCAMSRELCQDMEHQKLANNPVEEIILATRQMRRLFENINSAVLHDLERYYPTAYKNYVEHKDGFKATIIRNMEEGIKGGYYREDIDVQALAILRIESVDMAFNNALFPPRDFRLLDVQMTFIDHFLRGIVTEKGLKVYEAIK